MDAQRAQLRHQIEQTRTAIGVKLALLEQHVSQTVAATLEQTALAPVRDVQEAGTRSTMVLHQRPWLIIAGGALLSYQLRCASE